MAAARLANKKFLGKTQTGDGPDCIKSPAMGGRQHLDGQKRKGLLRVSRLFASGVLAAIAAFPGVGYAQAITKTPAAAHTVLVVGDSLSAEYGIARGTGWVALLQKQLQADPKRKNVLIVNASISGDTTSGGRSRLPALLAKHKPQTVLVELGGNDALRGLPLDMTEKNLAAMVQASEKAGAKVLLLGMQVPPNYGGAYGRAFSEVFVKVAKAEKVVLLPFFLQGIADGDNAITNFQADRIHPTQAAQPRMLANVWPVLEKMLP